MIQRFRQIWQRLFPESLEKEMAAAMLSSFAGQAKRF